MKKYNFVPSCLRCGSDATGYYVYCNESDSDKVIAEHMKKGELVRTRTGVRNPEDNNCFCNHCNAEWYGKIDTMKLSYEDIEDEKKLRGIEYDDIKRIRRQKEDSRKSIKQPWYKRIIRKMIKIVR